MKTNCQTTITTCLIEILKEKISSHLSSSIIQPDCNARTDDNKAAKGNYSLKAIVFTQYRDTAQDIVDTLNSSDITASRFVGVFIHVIEFTCIGSWSLSNRGFFFQIDWSATSVFDQYVYYASS